jgi:hypothetical protein
MDNKNRQTVFASESLTEGTFDGPVGVPVPASWSSAPPSGIFKKRIFQKRYSDREMTRLYVKSMDSETFKNFLNEVFDSERTDLQ